MRKVHGSESGYLTPPGGIRGVQEFYRTLSSERENELAKTESKLQQKIATIGELEEAHGIFGVSFAVKPHNTVRAEEAVDYVIDFIHRGVDAVQRRDEIPLASEIPQEVR